jgi:hypothetical protein
MNKEKQNLPCFIAVMMTSQKMMKVTAKCDETVIPDDPRIGIGLNIVTEPGGFNHDAVFETGGPPETIATTSTAKDSMFGCVDDDVLVQPF